VALNFRKKGTQRKLVEKEIEQPDEILLASWPIPTKHEWPLQIAPYGAVIWKI
jgi:hypothetical protein